MDSSTTDMTPRRYARLLTIAGSDSGGGAGIQADLKTFAALGCYGMSAITAITAQNTMGVTAIQPLPAALLTQQIDAVTADIGVDAVKIGMLHDPEVVLAVAAAIRRHGWTRVVLDPVMVATSGDALIARETVAVLVRELFPLATVVTPNLDEAALLLGRPVTTEAELPQAAADLLALGAPAMLLKGGHLAGDTLVDLLLQAGQAPVAMSGARIDSVNTHGTGCTLSSAIACHLALGCTLADAVRLSRDYVIAAIRHGADVKTGGGHGPLNHGFAPAPMQKLSRDAFVPPPA
jgi:hydroxymethylpyrimidine/phosphomethylpyrimidine kinase